MALDEWTNMSVWFISEVNYILEHLDLKIKTINQMILKIKNTSKYKYNQQ